MFFNDTHLYRLTVQFEEVDMAGVVHHPNYLKYFERARCDAMSRCGMSFGTVMKEGRAIVVAELHQVFLKPSYYEQNLTILTRFVAFKRSNMRIVQAICTHEPTPEDLQKVGDNFRALPDVIHVAQLRCVWIDLRTGMSCSTPDFIREALRIPLEREVADPSCLDVRLRL